MNNLSELYVAKARPLLKIRIGVVSYWAEVECVDCCLLQQRKPVAFTSKSLNEAEKNYPQIEKDMLGIVFYCRQFHNFIYGHKIIVQADHLPLVSIDKKNLR